MFILFDSDVLMLKYNKTHPHFLSFLFRDTTSYINIILKGRKHNFSDFYHEVLTSQNSIETLLKKNYENKNLSRALFPWLGGDAN